MNPLITTILAAVIAGLLGSGVCSIVLYFIQRHDKKKDEKCGEMTKQSDMLRGLAHDRIIYLCRAYIKRGSITSSELENLNTYLYDPYSALHGNGTAEKLKNEVNKLPIID